MIKWHHKTSQLWTQSDLEECDSQCEDGVAENLHVSIEEESHVYG